MHQDAFSRRVLGRADFSYLSAHSLPVYAMRIAFVAALVFVLSLTGAGLWAHSPPTPIEGKVDSLVVDKNDRTLHVYQEGTVTVTYPVALSIRPTGPKRFEGDGRVPEGKYHVTFHLEESIAYKALRISYPDPHDKQYAEKYGKDPGGLIEIHGMHPSMAWMGRLHTFFDYTLGCVAVTNPQMDQLYDHVPDGTPVRFVQRQVP
jgi:murein L,D-transpeptidase YafK